MVQFPKDPKRKDTIFLLYMLCQKDESAILTGRCQVSRKKAGIRIFVCKRLFYKFIYKKYKLFK